MHLDALISTTSPGQRARRRVPRTLPSALSQGRTASAAIPTARAPSAMRRASAPTVTSMSIAACADLLAQAGSARGPRATRAPPCRPGRRPACRRGGPHVAQGGAIAARHRGGVGVVGVVDHGHAGRRGDRLHAHGLGRGAARGPRRRGQLSPRLSATAAAATALYTLWRPGTGSVTRADPARRPCRTMAGSPIELDVLGAHRAALPQPVEGDRRRASFASRRRARRRRSGSRTVVAARACEFALGVGNGFLGTEELDVATGRRSSRGRRCGRAMPHSAANLSEPAHPHLHDRERRSPSRPRGPSVVLQAHCCGYRRSRSPAWSSSTESEEVLRRRLAGRPRDADNSTAQTRAMPSRKRLDRSE